MVQTIHWTNEGAVKIVTSIILSIVELLLSFRTITINSFLSCCSTDNFFEFRYHINCIIYNLHCSWNFLNMLLTKYYVYFRILCCWCQIHLVNSVINLKTWSKLTTITIVYIAYIFHFKCNMFANKKRSGPILEYPYTRNRLKITAQFN